MRTKILVLIFCIAGSHYGGFGQDTSLNIKLNKAFFRPGDTVQINASQAPGTNATLFLMAEHENGFVWEMRWPMLKGKCNASVILPDSMPQGQYRLFFSVLQNLFTVFGKVKTPDKLKELDVTLLTSAGEVYEITIPVNEKSLFIYKNVLFEDNATLLFTHPEKQNNDKLDIEISTVLDSAAYPLRNKTVDIFIGFEEPGNGIKPFTSFANDPDAKAQALETVTVYNKPMNRGELYNKKYSTGLFNDMNERMINFLDDRSLYNSISIFQTLRTRVAGLTLSYGPNPIAVWRGQGVAFYLDEIRVNAYTIDDLPVNDIAIIKCYPPPFFGNPAGNGGAIAVYTKRGGLSDDDYKNAFKVKGYTPQIFTLPTMPDRF